MDKLEAYVNSKLGNIEATIDQRLAERFAPLDEHSAAQQTFDEIHNFMLESFQAVDPDTGEPLYPEFLTSDPAQAEALTEAVKLFAPFWVSAAQKFGAEHAYSPEVFELAMQRFRAKHPDILRPQVGTSQSAQQLFDSLTPPPPNRAAAGVLTSGRGARPGAGPSDPDSSARALVRAIGRSGRASNGSLPFAP